MLFFRKPAGALVCGPPWTELDGLMVANKMHPNHDGSNSEILLKSPCNVERKGKKNSWYVLDTGKQSGKAQFLGWEMIQIPIDKEFEGAMNANDLRLICITFKIKYLTKLGIKIRNLTQRNLTIRQGQDDIILKQTLSKSYLKPIGIPIMLLLVLVASIRDTLTRVNTRGNTGEYTLATEKNLTEGKYREVVLPVKMFPKKLNLAKIEKANCLMPSLHPM